MVEERVLSGCLLLLFSEKGASCRPNKLGNPSTKMKAGQSFKWNLLIMMKNIHSLLIMELRGRDVAASPWERGQGLGPTVQVSALDSRV